MDLHISFAPKNECYNIYDSYDQICVGCGCCSKDAKERAEARLNLYKRRLDEQLHFDHWLDEPYLKALQEKNIKENIELAKRRIRYYTRRLEQLGNRNG